jgi:16S rRNA (guanine527-N7)-methyltransferase
VKTEAPQDELATLRQGATELGLCFGPDLEANLLRYLDLVYVWNRAAGLTTIVRANAVRLHLLDSLAALPSVTGSPCLDLGTGAGLPGLVLAIVAPATSFVLVESNRRRCSFLLEVVRLLGLRNVRVIESDVESLPKDVRYPVVISRAFRPPVEFAGIASRFVTGDGRVVLMLADPTPE